MLQSTTEFPVSQEDQIQRFAAMCAVKRFETRAALETYICLGLDTYRPLDYDPAVTIPEYKTIYWVCLSREIERSGEDFAYLASVIRTMDTDYQAEVGEVLKLIDQHAARQFWGVA